MSTEPEAPLSTTPELTSTTPPTTTTETTPPEGTPPAPESLITKPAPEFTPLEPTDISFGENVEVNEELQSELISVFNNQELDSKARAQALVDLHTKAMQQALEAPQQAWTEMQDQWKEEVKADAVVGGEKLQPALDRIGKVVNEFGSPQLLEVFAATGAGNNVHVIKFLNAVASKLTEGGPVSGFPATQEKSAAAKMFPSAKG